MSSTSLVKFVPRNFIIFNAFFISLSASLLLLHKNRLLYSDFVLCNFSDFTFFLVLTVFLVESLGFFMYHITSYYIM